MLNEDEEDDDDDYNGDLVSSDIEQIQNLLEFKVNTHTHTGCSYIWQMFAECFSPVSAWGSAVLGEWAREPKTEVSGACKLHKEPADRSEE